MEIVMALIGAAIAVTFLMFALGFIVTGLKVVWIIVTLQPWRGTGPGVYIDTRPPKPSQSADVTGKPLD